MESIWAANFWIFGNKLVPDIAGNLNQILVKCWKLVVEFSILSEYKAINLPLGGGRFLGYEFLNFQVFYAVKAFFIKTIIYLYENMFF